MQVLVDQLPFFDRTTTLRIAGGPAVSVKDHQIVVWVSVTQSGLPSIPANTRRFPAIIDTRFNHNFLLQEQQLSDWGGIEPQSLVCVSQLIVRGNGVPLRDADVWIHQNQAGFRDQFTGATPFRLQLDNGIAVCSDAMNYPRLPLLGVRALKRNQLELILEGASSRFSLRIP